MPALVPLSWRSRAPAIRCNRAFVTIRRLRRTLSVTRGLTHEDPSSADCYSFHAAARGSRGRLYAQSHGGQCAAAYWDNRFTLGGGDWTYARQESTGERICRNHKVCSLLLCARLETASQSSYGFASEDQTIQLRWCVQPSRLRN